VSIILVRHAEPVAVRQQAPGRWPLSEAGRRAARRLRDRLPGSGVWVSSTETRAYETLACAREGARTIARDPGFDEVRRDEPFEDGFRARRRAWVEGELDDRHAGWESPRDAADRFDGTVQLYVMPDVPLVVASHGMVLTAWLVHGRGWLAPEDAGDFWEGLSFPDVVELP
jgi:broad specificity phosphatase PhoE